MKIENNFFQSNKSFISLEDPVKNRIKFNKKLQNDMVCQFLDDKEIDELLNKDQTTLSNRVIEAFKVLNAGAYKADILRYYLLYTRGGVWLDDKSILRINISDSFFGLDIYDGFFIHDKSHHTIEIGFIAARKGHPLIYEFLIKALENVENRIYSTINIGITGPHMATKLLTDKNLSLDGSSINYYGTSTLILHSNRNKLLKSGKIIWCHDDDIDSTWAKYAKPTNYFSQWKLGTVYTDDNSQKPSSAINYSIIFIIFLACCLFIFI